MSLRCALVAFLGSMVAMASSAVAAPPPMTEYVIPTPDSTPLAITAGPDGGLWFVETNARQIGRLDPATGHVDEYPLPDPSFTPIDIAPGPDGAVWFAEADLNSFEEPARIGRIAPNGAISEIPLPNGGDPSFIALGPDDAVWVVSLNATADPIARVSPDGDVRLFPVPSGIGPFTGGPWAITTGPDGALWMTSPVGGGSNGHSLLRLTASGVGARFPMDQAGVGDASPYDIAAGPDGALWFSMPRANGFIGRMTTDGQVTYTSIPAGSSDFVASGPDGAVWFTASASNSPPFVGRVDSAGHVDLYRAPTTVNAFKTVAGGITSGPDGNVWFTEFTANRIVKVQLEDPGDADQDGDGVPDSQDNCPSNANPDQRDVDGDGHGDLCDADRDGDGVGNGGDNCVDVPNSSQADADADGLGDVCDGDRDGDGHFNGADNCPDSANVDQLDTDGDGMGDACDVDRDGDNVPDESDNCPAVPNSGQADADFDTVGDACDGDRDGDGHQNAMDNCPDAANPDQADWDRDGQGDACDPDRPPAQQLADLIDAVAGFPIPAGTQRSLTAKLQAALAAYNAGDLDKACSKLNSFVHEVEAQSGKKIPSGDADRLLDDARRVDAAIGC